MNRHRNFYKDLDDYMDDDDYDEYDDYYEEGMEECYDANGLQGHAGTVQPSDAGSRTTEMHGLNDQDVDYALLETLLPEFYRRWSAIGTSGKCENDRAIEALRLCNYDVDEALAALGTACPKDASGVPPVTSGKSRTLRLETNKDGPNGEPQEAVKKMQQTSDGDVLAHASAKPKRQAPPKGKQHLANETAPKSTKEECTFVVTGHVDAGKSTTVGHLLLMLGRVTQSEVDQNEKNGRQLKKESFKFAWLLDQSEEERRRGITIDSGSYCFETEHRRINVLDAPGHKDYVLNMTSSATQADAALLVVTAAFSEFEVGLAHGTKDHLVVLKILGIGHLVVAVNKMDTVGYSQERYDTVVRELKLLLKQFRFKDDAVVGFCPVSGMKGTNISKTDSASTPWYTGPPLLELLDRCPLESRFLDASLRLSVQDVQDSRIFCKVECGKLRKSDRLIFVPADVKVHVRTLERPTAGGLVEAAFAGDTVVIDTSSSLVGLYPGCVGCDAAGSDVTRCSTDFKARVQTYAALPRAILPGTRFTMVCHALTVEVQVLSLLAKMGQGGTWSTGMVKCISRSTQALIVFKAERKIPLEPAEVCRALGRFVLQQDGETVAGGLVEAVML